MTRQEAYKELENYMVKIKELGIECKKRIGITRDKYPNAYGYELYIDNKHIGSIYVEKNNHEKKQWFIEMWCESYVTVYNEYIIKKIEDKIEIENNLRYTTNFTKYYYTLDDYLNALNNLWLITKTALNKIKEIKMLKDFE